MTNVTDLEKAVLINITENEMTELNGAVPENYEEYSGCWLSSVDYGGPVPSPKGKSLGGVLSSLEKKKLVNIWVEKKQRGCPDESTIDLTPEGFKVYQTFGRKD